MFLVGGFSYATTSIDIIIDDERPTDIVNVSTIIPQIQLDMRYYTSHNFVGRPITGYNSASCLLTKAATTALKQVENQLSKKVKISDKKELSPFEKDHMFFVCQKL